MAEIGGPLGRNSFTSADAQQPSPLRPPVSENCRYCGGSFCWRAFPDDTLMDEEDQMSPKLHAVFIIFALSSEFGPRANPP